MNHVAHVVLGGILLGGALIGGAATASAAPCDAYSQACPSAPPAQPPAPSVVPSPLPQRSNVTTLPFTGSEVVLMIVVGLGAIAGGGALVAAGRRAHSS